MNLNPRLSKDGMRKSISFIHNVPINFTLAYTCAAKLKLQKYPASPQMNVSNVASKIKLE